MKWKEINRETFQYAKYRSCDIVDFELANGKRATYTLSSKIDVVCVFALTTAGKVLLARQYRPGPDATLDELPGGAVELGEDFEMAMKRELLEETGYKPGEVVYLGRFFDCAYSQLTRHAYFAKDCVKVSEQKLDEGEFVEVVLKSVDEFIIQIKSGLATDLEVAWAGMVEAGIFKRA